VEVEEVKTPLVVAEEVVKAQSDDEDEGIVRKVVRKAREVYEYLTDYEDDDEDEERNYPAEASTDVEIEEVKTPLVVAKEVVRAGFETAAEVVRNVYDYLTDGGDDDEENDYPLSDSEQEVVGEAAGSLITNNGPTDDEVIEALRKNATEIQLAAERQKASPSFKRKEREVTEKEAKNQFFSAGKSPGLEMFKVEWNRTVNDKPKVWSSENRGIFYEQDCYIIINTYRPRDKNGKEKKEFCRDVHLWIGKDAEDVLEAAEHKFKVFDNLPEFKATHHRELQGHESDLFQSYFKENGLTYMKGSSDSAGYDPRKKDEYEPRLYAVRKVRKAVKVVPVPLKLESLHHNGVYIFDAGETISVWNGKNSDAATRFAAGTNAQKWIDSRRGKARQGFPNEVFMNLVTNEGVTPTEDDVVDGDDAAYEAIFADINVKNDQRLDRKSLELYEISDATGELRFTHKKTGTLSIDMLHPDEAYLVYSNVGIYIWIGNGASKNERERCLEIADTYIHEKQLDSEFPLPVTRILQDEASNSSAFLNLFTSTN